MIFRGPRGKRWWWWCLWVDVGIWWITDGGSGMMLVMCMVWEIHGIWRCLLMDLRPSSLLGEVLMVFRRVCLGWLQSFLGLPQPPHYLDTWTLALSAMTWQRVSLAPHGLSRQLDHTSALEVLKYNIHQKYIVWWIDTTIIIITNIASVQEGFTIPTIWWTWLHIGRKNYCPTTWPSETSSSFFSRIIFKIIFDHPNVLKIMGWPSIGQTINSTVSAESFARDNIIGGWRRHLGSILYGAAWHWNFIVAPPGNLNTGNLNSQLGPKSKFQASSVDTSSEEVHRSLWYS